MVRVFRKIIRYLHLIHNPLFAHTHIQNYNSMCGPTRRSEIAGWRLERGTVGKNYVISKSNAVFIWDIFITLK